ncbi:MAG: hypothetical protein ABW163_10150 [Luteimonas sp.]
MKDESPRTRTTPVLILALMLAACSNDAPRDAPSGSGTAATSAPSERSGGPASCDGLSLTEGAAIVGDDLGRCIVDYLAFAGSGASHTTSETASSRMVWRMGDGYEAYAELDSGVRMTTTGDRSWVDFDGTGWVEADPATPGMDVAFGIVEAWREASAPALTRRMIAAAPVWTVGPSRSVDLPDGTSRTLVEVTASAPFDWSGATISAMTLWMDAPGRIILQVVTAGAAGHSATSTTHFTQWGGAVEIPDPAAGAGAR